LFIHSINQSINQWINVTSVAMKFIEHSCQPFTEHHLFGCCQPFPPFLWTLQGRPPNVSHQTLGGSVQAQRQTDKPGVL
jgi:hypothetical protein